MQFDHGSQEFVLDLVDRTLLQVPEEMARWPKDQWESLAECVSRAQSRTESMDETLYPQGVMRNEMRGRILRSSEKLGSMRTIMSQHVDVDTSEIDKLLGEQ